MNIKTKNTLNIIKAGVYLSSAILTIAFFTLLLNKCNPEEEVLTGQTMKFTVVDPLEEIPLSIEVELNWSEIDKHFHSGNILKVNGELMSIKGVRGMDVAHFRRAVEMAVLKALTNQ